MEVEDCREPLREGGRLMGVNQGTAEVSWNLWVFLCWLSDSPHLSVYSATAGYRATVQNRKNRLRIWYSFPVYHSNVILTLFISRTMLNLVFGLKAFVLKLSYFIVLIFLNLKGNAWGVQLHMWKVRAFCGSRAWNLINGLRWCHLSQRRLGLKTICLRMKKIWGCGVRKKWAYQTSVARSSSLLEATLSATKITHPNLQPNCQWSSHIVGNAASQVLTRKKNAWN